MPSSQPPSSPFSKFAFTHSEVRAKPQFKFHKHIINNNNNNNNNTITNLGSGSGAKPRAAVFDGIRIIRDLRAVTGMCGACK